MPKMNAPGELFGIKIRPDGTLVSPTPTGAQASKANYNNTGNALLRAMGLKIGKDQGVSGSEQSSNNYNVLSKRTQAMDPHQVVRTLGMYKRLKPWMTGMKKQEDTVKGIEGGLGAILQGFKDSPASALKLKGVASGVDQLFGTNTKDIITDTGHNLLMNLPKLAELASNERYKSNTVENQLLSKLMSDYSTEKTGMSEMDNLNYKKGLEALSKGANKTPSWSEQKGISTMAMAHKNQYMDVGLKDTFNQIGKIYSKPEYVLGPRPVSRSRLLELAKTAKTVTKESLGEWFGMDLTSAQEKSILADRESIRRLYEKAKVEIARMQQGKRLTDKDLDNVAKQLADDWESGDWNSKINAVNKFIDEAKKKNVQNYALLPDAVKFFMNSQGDDPTTFWDDVQPIQQGKQAEEKASSDVKNDILGIDNDGAESLEGL